jgi:hypothetical protein
MAATYGHGPICLCLSFCLDDLTDDAASPLHVPPQPLVLPDDSPSIVHAKFQLIVVSNLSNGGHFKALASPLFALFFDASHIDPPSERTDDSKNKSDGHGLRMALGSGGAMI